MLVSWPGKTGPSIGKQVTSPGWPAVGGMTQLRLSGVRHAHWPKRDTTNNTRVQFSHRKCLRTTSLRPDQISVTAHTFTSTRSVASANRLISPSVTSFGIFAAFLYQEPQSAPSRF